jgi:quercetin dioxygenase-like cupin family protein
MTYESGNCACAAEQATGESALPLATTHRPPVFRQLAASRTTVIPTANGDPHTRVSLAPYPGSIDMDIARFETDLRSDGYERIENKQLAAGTCSAEHEHPFDVRALILEGETTISAAGVTRTYSRGEGINIAAGCPHAEQVGANGVSFIIAMRACVAG